MRFCFTVHNHQPVGNFDHVVDDATTRAYLPFLGALAEVPAMEVGLHYSGTLLLWAKEHRPELVDRIASVADQVELIGGGLHEPILAAIPDDWRRRQLRRHRELVQDLFATEPLGVWIAERLWEPTLAWLLADLDIGHTFLDDTLFDTVAAPRHRTAVVEHLDRAVRVLPISTQMRDLIPSADVGAVMTTLAGIHASDPDALVVLADDGEKFGGWKNTSHVHDRGWLVEFFTELVTTDWIDVVRPSAAATGPAVAAALGAGSYSQMQSWLTEPGRTSPAPWKHFLTRHPEANVMYRKMLNVASAKLSDTGVSHVLAAQANDAYWHGAFGGVFHPHLRAAVHTNLIAARTDAERGRRGRSWSDVTVADWDRDGDDEIHAELPDQSWVLTDTGAFVYYDDKPSAWCVSDVVQPGPDDTHTVGRLWLRDRWAPSPPDPHALESPPEAFTYTLGRAEAARGSVAVSMHTRLADWEIEKSIRAVDRSVEVSYAMTGAPPGRFGPELPIALWRGAIRIRIDGGPWTDVIQAASYTGHRFRIEHVGRGVQVLVDLRLPGTLDLHPLIASVVTDQGEEHIFQGVIAWPNLFIDGDGTHSVKVTIVDVEDGAGGTTEVVQ